MILDVFFRAVWIAAKRPNQKWIPEERDCFYLPHTRKPQSTEVQKHFLGSTTQCVIEIGEKTGNAGGLSPKIGNVRFFLPSGATQPVR